MRWFLKENGFSALAAVAIMFLLGIFGIALSSLVTTSHTTRIGQVSYDQANFTNYAGLEYGMKRYYEGKNPAAGRVSFGSGSFRITQSGPVMQVTGLAGESQVDHQVSLPTQANCLEVDTSEAHTHHRGMELARIWLIKKCGTVVELDRMILSWSPDQGECYDKARLDSVRQNRIFDAPPCATSGMLVDLINPQMTRNQKHKFKDIEFPRDMRSPERSFRLQFFLKDGSQTDTRFTLGPCPHSSC